jgi:hypothetical protein
MIGCCGIDCSECGAYIANKENDDTKRVEVAKEWSDQYNADIKPEQIFCNGCTSEGPWFFYTENICEIRKCCMGKSLSNCASCEEYPCDKLEGFFKQVPDARRSLDSFR